MRLYKAKQRILHNRTIIRAQVFLHLSLIVCTVGHMNDRSFGSESGAHAEKPLKELKMLIAFRTGFTINISFEMFISTYFLHCDTLLSDDGNGCRISFSQFSFG